MLSLLLLLFLLSSHVVVAAVVSTHAAAAAVVVVVVVVSTHADFAAAASAALVVVVGFGSGDHTLAVGLVAGIIAVVAVFDRTWSRDRLSGCCFGWYCRCAFCCS